MGTDDPAIRTVVERRALRTIFNRWIHRRQSDVGWAVDGGDLETRLRSEGRAQELRAFEEFVQDELSEYS